jgi:hypothetical protein
MKINFSQYDEAANQKREESNAENARVAALLSIPQCDEAEFFVAPLIN